MIKNIVIIEDDIKHFQIISRLIARNDVDVFPKGIIDKEEEKEKKNELQNFLSPIKAMLEDSDNARRKTFLDHFLLDDRLKKEGKSVPISLFIIDYELYRDHESITGIELCDNIEDIKEGRIPVILLTILTDGAIDNEKTRFVTKSEKEYEKKYKTKGGAKIEKLSKTLNRGDDGFVRTWNEDHREIDEILKDMRRYSEIKDTLNSTIDRLCANKNNEINSEIKYRHVHD